MNNASWIAEVGPVLRRIPGYAKLASGLIRDRETPTRAKAMSAVAIAYSLAPVDLVPGVVPVFGQLDDLLLPLILIRRALRHCPVVVRNRHLKAEGLTLATSTMTSAGSGEPMALPPRSCGAERGASAPPSLGPRAGDPPAPGVSSARARNQNHPRKLLGGNHGDRLPSRHRCWRGLGGRRAVHHLLPALFNMRI